MTLFTVAVPSGTVACIALLALPPPAAAAPPPVCWGLRLNTNVMAIKTHTPTNMGMRSLTLAARSSSAATWWGSSRLPRPPLPLPRPSSCYYGFVFYLTVRISIRLEDSESRKERRTTTTTTTPTTQETNLPLREEHRRSVPSFIFRPHRAVETGNYSRSQRRRR